MLKVFTQSIATTNDSTIARDTALLENAVNTFIKQGSVNPQSQEFSTISSGGVLYYVIVLEYNQVKK